MDLQTAILALLGRAPASGYDLKGLIAESDLYPWSGNNNQIYKVLLELQGQGLVSFEILDPESLPVRKVYSLTDAGRAQLARGLRQPPEAPEWRKTFLLQLEHGAELSDAELRSLLTAYRVEVAARLDLTLGQARRAADQPASNTRQAWLTARVWANLVASFEAELAWVEQTLMEIDG